MIAMEQEQRMRERGNELLTGDINAAGAGAIDGGEHATAQRVGAALGSGEVKPGL